jgi:tetratricopeptide (TPR) repeat protein
MNYVSKIKWLPIVCITIWGAAIYSNILRVPFVFDDLVYIQNNPILKNPLNLADIIGFAPSRWIGFFTFGLNYYFGQENTFGYHLVNLVIHIGSAISCYWLVLLTFRTPRLRDQASSDFKSTMALLAGLIFVSHPVQTEAVTYIWQRVESLAAFFYLLSLASYVKSRLEEDRNRKSSKVNPLIYYVASCVLAYMSAMTKEIAVTLPATIILYEILFFGNIATRFRRVMLKATPFLCLLIIVPVLAQKSPTVTENLLYESPPTWSYMLTQTRVIAAYLRLLVWPVEQNLDYDFPLSQSLLEPEVLLSVSLIMLIVILGLLLYKTSPLVTFGTVWFFLTLSPTSSIIALPDLIFEHRLYLPLVGFVFVMTGIIAALRKHWRPLSMVMIIVLLLFSAGTYYRNSIWQNDLTLWQDTVRKSPLKARPRVNLAISYVNVGEYDQALDELSHAVALKPDYAAAHENMGVAYFRKGAYQQAIAAFKKAIDLDSSQTSTYNAVAEAYMHVGKKDLAMKNFKKALSLNPSLLSARNNLGLILAEKGLYSRAIAEFERLIQFEPGFLDAYHNLGILYLNFLDKPDEAKRYFERELVLTKDSQMAAQIKEIIIQIEGTHPGQRTSHETDPP